MLPTLRKKSRVRVTQRGGLISLNRDVFSYLVAFLPLREVVLTKRVSRALHENAIRAVDLVKSFELLHSDRIRSDMGLNIFVNVIKSHKLEKLHLLRGCKGIETLNFSVQYFQIVTQKFINLESLCFGLNPRWIQDETNNVLLFISNNLSRLCTLNIETPCRRLGPSKLDLSLLLPLRNLTRFGFCGFWEVVHLAEFLTKCRTLRALSLRDSGNAFISGDFEKLSQDTYPHITYFKFYASLPKVAEISRAIPRIFPRLEELHMIMAHPELETLRGILNMKEIRRLHLWHVSFIDQNFSTTFMGGNVCPQVEVFNPLLGLSDSALIGMAQVMPNLKKLGLGRNVSQVTEEGLRKAAKYLVHLEELGTHSNCLSTHFLDRETLQDLLEKGIFPNLERVVNNAGKRWDNMNF